VLEAKFSLQHGIAIALEKGEPELGDFEPEAIARLVPLRAQVTVAEDPALTAGYPAHFGARIDELVLADTLGDPERPLSPAQIEAKARALIGWGGADPDAIVAAALHGDDAAALIDVLEQWV